MKRTVIFWVAQVVVTLLMAACQGTPKGYYEIEGRIKGADEGMRLVLFRTAAGRVGEQIASDTLHDGRFSFRITPISEGKEHLNLLCLSPNSPMMGLNFWASAGDRVKVRGEGNLQYTWRVKGPALEIASQQAFTKAARDLWIRLQEVMVEENHLRASASASEADPAALQRAYDSLGDLQWELTTQIMGREVELMKRRKVDDVWMQHLSQVADFCLYDETFPHREAAEELFEALSEERKVSEAGKKIATKLFPPKHVEAGEELIDGELYDLEGNPHTLGELRGAYILLDFWSLGCGPCIMALPEMGEIAESYKGRLQVVSITTDPDEQWRKGSEAHRMTWHNWSDGKGESGLYAAYYQGGIPNYTLISPEGIILEQWMGYGPGSLKQKVAPYMH